MDFDSGDAVLTLFLLIFGAALVGIGFLVDKGMDNEAIQAYIDDGAKFAEAYCAVHEPEQLKTCYDRLTSK